MDKLIKMSNIKLSKILVTIAISSIIGLGSLQGTAYALSSTQTSGGDNTSLTATYLVQSNNGEMIEVSNVTLFNSSWVYVNVTEVTQGNVNTYNNSSYLLPMNALQVSISTESAVNSMLKFPNTQGTVWLNRTAQYNKQDLVTYGFVQVTDTVAGLDSFWSVKLLSAAGNFASITVPLSNIGEYFIFLPQLVPPSQFSNSTSMSGENLGKDVPSSVVTSQSSSDPNYGEFRLNEKDNHVTNLGLWYIFTNLTLGPNIPGQGSVSGNAVVWAIDWEVLEPYSSTLVITDGGWILNGSGNAEFYGVFPYGSWDAWEAFPEVSVTWFYSNGTFTGYINDYIEAYNSGTYQWYFWSDTVVKVVGIPGHETITEWVIS